MRLLKFILILGCLVPNLLWATHFVAGKDYQLVTTKTPDSWLVPGKVTVIEFFSYGCPWCAQLEGPLATWLQTKPPKVVFKRVPVIFEANWEAYAKLFYTAQLLGIESKMTPVLFKAVQQQGLDLTNDRIAAQLFSPQGISEQQFASAYNFAPALAEKMKKGDEIARAYNIMEIPTLVINGKYRVNNAMVGGDTAKFIAVVNDLIQKSL